MDLCPCGSNLSYAECCEPIINEQSFAKTAEQLMRSRYTAFAKNELEHLVNTTILAKRESHDAESTEEWAKNSQWKGFEIIKTEAGGEEDTKGSVEFIVTFSQNNADFKHHELATFEKEDNKWYFVDGDQITPKPYIRKSVKVGRNDPCPCKSGKKYKKCCGK